MCSKGIKVLYLIYWFEWGFIGFDFLLNTKRFEYYLNKKYTAFQIQINHNIKHRLGQILLIQLSQNLIYIVPCLLNIFI